MAGVLTEWAKLPGTKEFLLRLHKKFIDLRRNKENVGTTDSGMRIKDSLKKEVEVVQKLPSKQDEGQHVSQLSSEDEEQYLLLLILVTSLIDDEGTDEKVIGQLKAIQKGISQVLRMNDQKWQVFSPEMMSTLASEMTDVFRMKGSTFCNLNLNVSEANVTTVLKLVTSSNFKDDLAVKNHNINSKNRIKGHVFLYYILSDILGLNISKP